MIRVATPEDAEAFAAIYAPFVRDTPVSFEEEPPSVQEMARRIEKVLRTHPWLALGNEGFAYASPHRDRAGYRWSVDTTVYLAPQNRGKGHGRALYAALLPILRAQGFVAAHAGIALPNAASVGLHEAVGFRPTALYPRVGFKAGAWHDVGWWTLDLAPRESPPAEPVAFPALDPGVLRSAGVAPKTFR